MNGHSHTSQSTPSFDALFGDRTGLTPYGAGPNDPNPFDSNYALALAQRASLGDGVTQYANFDGGGALLDGFGFDKTPPSDNSPPNGPIDESSLAGLDSAATHALNTFNGPQQYDSNMAQRLFAMRGSATGQDGTSLNLTDAEHLALPGVRYGDSVNIQTNKPLSHLDLLRRNSSEQSVDSSSSVSPAPNAVQNRKLGSKIGARRGGAGSTSTAEVKRGTKASTGEPAPKVRRRSTAASASSPIMPDAGDDEGKRAEFLERNRIAASKCRHKKKEWTNNLEAAARQASQQSRELQAIVAELQSELIHYQNELLAHQNCGNCDIQSYLGNLARSRSHSYEGNGYHQ